MITKNVQVCLLTTAYHKKIIKQYLGPGWTQKEKHTQKFYASPHFPPNSHSPITMVTHVIKAGEEICESKLLDLQTTLNFILCF